MADWRRFCTNIREIIIEGDGVNILTVNERRHRILIRETIETFELTGVVARSAALSEMSNVALGAWRRNRTTQLVGFRVDRKGRLVGETWIPKPGLEREEFLIYLRRVAAECDLFEYHLTGRDQE